MLQKYSFFLTVMMCIHLNTTSLKELKHVLPGVSVKNLQNVIEYRQLVGEFYSIYELEFVKGFGPHFVDRYFEKITMHFCL